MATAIAPRSTRSHATQPHSAPSRLSLSQTAHSQSTQGQPEQTAKTLVEPVRSLEWTCLCCDNVYHFKHPLNAPAPCTCGSLSFEPGSTREPCKEEGVNGSLLVTRKGSKKNGTMHELSARR